MTSSLCFENAPNLSSTCGNGCVEEFGGLKTYITGSQHSRLSILLISDVFAKVVVELAKSDYIQAAVLLHPSFVALDDIKAVNAPIAILGAEIDRMSPPELLEQFEEALTVKPQVNSFVKVFPSVAHGWTVRYNVEDATAVNCAEEAHQNMLDWFAKFIK